LLLIFSAVAPLARGQSTIDLRRSTPTVVRDITTKCTVLGAGDDGLRDGFPAVSGVARTSGGAVFVLSTPTAELFRFSPNGRYSGLVARAGAGPGELSKNPNPVGLDVRPFRGDSVAVFDRTKARVSIFDRNGRLGRTLQVPQNLSSVLRTPNADLVAAAFPSGDLVFKAQQPSAPLTMSSGESLARSFRAIITIARMSATGDSVWTSPPLEDAMMYVGASSLSRSSDGVQTIRSSSPRPVVTRPRSIGVVGDLVLHYVETANELHVYDGQGRRTSRILLPDGARTPPQPTATAVSRALMVASDGGPDVWIEVPTESPEHRVWWRLVNGQSLDPRAVRVPYRDHVLAADKQTMVLRSYDEDLVQTVRICPLPDA
jgi:hypothetical protein